MATAVALGVGIAALATLGRLSLKAYQRTGSTIPAGASSTAFTSFYRGGFEPTMNKREAALILGVRESVGRDKIKEAHRRVMLANHPDRGGSPFLAMKVNEAKVLMEKGSR